MLRILNKSSMKGRPQAKQKVVKPETIQLNLNGHLCKITKYNRLKFRHIEDHTDTADKLNVNAKAMLEVNPCMNFAYAYTNSQSKYLYYIEDTYGVGTVDTPDGTNRGETFHLSFDSKSFLVQLPHGMKVVPPDISTCIGLDCIIAVRMTKYEFKSKLDSNIGEVITGVNLTLVSIRVGTV